MKKVSEDPAKTKKILDFFSYSLKYGSIEGMLYGYVPMPKKNSIIVRNSWKNKFIDKEGKPIWTLTAH
jgi:hypothetical protein